MGLTLALLYFLAGAAKSWPGQLQVRVSRQLLGGAWFHTGHAQPGDKRGAERVPVRSAAPVVGLPLPLMSYGGTSMFVTFAALGLAMNAHIHARDTIRAGAVRPFL